MPNGNLDTWLHQKHGVVALKILDLAHRISISVDIFRKGNILISQLLHRSMHMVVPYYKPERNGPGYLKNKVLRHKVKKGLKTSTRKQFYY